MSWLISHSYFVKIWTDSKIEVKTYLIESFIHLLKFVNYFIGRFLSKKTINSNLIALPYKKVILSLFIISLVVGTGSDLQISELPSSRNIPGNLTSQAYTLKPISLTSLMLILLLLGLVIQIMKSNFDTKVWRFEVIFVLFFVFSQLINLFSFNPQASFIWILKLLTGFLVYIIFSRMRLEKKDFIYISFLFVAIVFFQQFLAFVQLITGSATVGLLNENTSTIGLSVSNNNIEKFYYFRPIGTFSHPNTLSSFIALTFPILLSVLLVSTYKYIKLIIYLALFLGILVILITLSRWGLLTGLFSLVLCVIFFKKNFHFGLDKTIYKKTLLVGIVIFIFLIFNPFTANRFLKFDVSDRSLNSRIELINESLYILQANPLGIGGGSFRSFLLNYDVTNLKLSESFLAPVHGYYLLLTTELGLFGLFLFILGFIDFTVFFFEKINLIEHRQKILATAFFASSVVFMFGNILESRTLDSRIGYFFFLFLGLVVNLLNRNSSRN